MVHDSHAEILVSKALEYYLYGLLNKDEKSREKFFVFDNKTSKYKLKKEISVILYIS